jgi:membrane protein insertase Oxa1/YidC/SpoIIIJ
MILMGIDALHQTTGLPWWMSIIVTTLAMRLALLPVGIISVILSTFTDPDRQTEDPTFFL